MTGAETLGAVRLAPNDVRAAILRELLAERLSTLQQFLARHELEVVAENICRGEAGMLRCLDVLAPQ